MKYGIIAPPTIVIIKTLDAVLTNASGISVIARAKIVGKLIDIKKKDAIRIKTDALPVTILSKIIIHTLIRE